MKKEILNNLKNTYCRLKPSKIEGIGVFAIKDIPKGKNPFLGIKQQRWYKFQISELKSLGKEILPLVDSFFVIHKNGTVEISESCLNGMDISYYLNNSKKPNIKTIDDGENFITLRKIKKGEELTVAYSTYDEKFN
ncbi:MAG: SET domain-containing protein [Patescibacteria group bacterium]